MTNFSLVVATNFVVWISTSDGPVGVSEYGPVWFGLLNFSYCSGKRCFPRNFFIALEFFHFVIAEGHFSSFLCLY